MLAERYTKTIIRGKAGERYKLPVFHSARTQGGHGLGCILGGLFRRAMNFLSSGAKILGQQAMNVASDMIDCKLFQDSAKIQLKEGTKTFVTSNPIIPRSGSGVKRKRCSQPSRKRSKKSKNRRIEDRFS